MTASMAVPTPARRPVPAPQPPVQVSSGGTSLSAAEAIYAGMRAATDAGIPGPIRLSTVGDRIEAVFPLPDLLRWAQLLADPRIIWWPLHLPAAQAEYVEVEGILDGHEWALRPLVERCPTVDGNGVPRPCTGCDELARVGR